MTAGRMERELICALSDDELQSRAAMLCETVTKIDEVQAARTSRMKAYKELLTGLAEEQRKLVRVIRERAEKRIVLCAAQYHMPMEGIKRIVRLDTGEVVAEEPMTDGEKQLNLFAAQSEFDAFLRQQGLDMKLETPDVTLETPKETTDGESETPPDWVE